MTDLFVNFGKIRVGITTIHYVTDSHKSVHLKRKMMFWKIISWVLAVGVCMCGKMGNQGSLKISLTMPRPHRIVRYNPLHLITNLLSQIRLFWQHAVKLAKQCNTIRRIQRWRIRWVMCRWKKVCVLMWLFVHCVSKVWVCKNWFTKT